MVGLKVRLRALEPADADILYAWENDPATWEAGDRKWPVSLADIECLIEHSDLDIWQTRQTRFMIDAVDSDKSVGCVDVFDFDPLNMHCSLGVFVEPASRGLGYGSEAITLIEDFARNVLMAHVVNVSVAADNEQSLALFAAAGYERAGLLKHNLRRARAFVDEVLLQKVFGE